MRRFDRMGRRSGPSPDEDAAPKRHAVCAAMQAHRRVAGRILGGDIETGDAA